MIRKDTRFNRPPRDEIQSRLNTGILNDSQALGVWEMIARSDDPSEVCRHYRSYRDSDHCTVPRDHLRNMRDTMIAAMREENRKDSNPRKVKKKGVHYAPHNDGWQPQRTGA